MLDSKDTQFTLSAEGKILWQEKPNNPLPGVEVAHLIKSNHPMRPDIDIIVNDITQNIDRDKLRNQLKIWLNRHLHAVLEPLMMLDVPDTGAAQDVRDIASAVFDALGIVERSSLEMLINKLDTEMRTALRAKKIRLGPVLVFIPALTKPASVRLRALLWSIYHEQPLPARVPADGIVSTRIEEEDANSAFYRAIGYPLYGGRAIRIDMLDRLISAVYDGAQHGKFQAKHQMAEWLGCPIEDLYKVLTAMGHTQIVEEQQSIEDNAAPATAELEQSEKLEENPEKKMPELAFFMLRRGKAFEKTPMHKKQHQDKHDQKDKRDKRDGDHKKKDFKKSKDKNKGKDKSGDRGPRVISVEAKHRQDSPFAILQQLKAKSDG